MHGSIAIKVLSYRRLFECTLTRDELAKSSPGVGSEVRNESAGGLVQRIFALLLDSFHLHFIVKNVL